MDRFARLHPVVHFVFFVFTFVFVLSISSPFFYAVSLISALAYSAYHNVKDALSSAKLSAVILVMTSVFNFAFAHYGEDVLFVIGSTEFTMESLFYGFCQGMVLCSVMLWFSILSRIADSERVIYFLRWAPKMALIFSMVLSFIPRFKKKATDIKNAQLALNNGQSDSSLKGKWHRSVSVLSALTTYSLESSIVTANSMNARGYNPSAQRGNRYRTCATDIVTLLLLVIAAIIICAEKIMGNIVFVFDPKIYSEKFSILAITAFFILQLLPLVIDVVEDIRWKISASKA